MSFLKSKIILQTQNFFKKQSKITLWLLTSLLIILIITLGVSTNMFQSEIGKLKTTILSLQKELSNSSKELQSLKSQDQYVINKKLQAEIDNIQKTYKKAVAIYEKLLDFKQKSKDTADLDKLFAQSLTDLSDRNYSSASANLDQIASNITTEENKLAKDYSIPQNVPVNNAPPSSGFNRQSVSVDGQNYLIDIIAGDLGSTRVIVDTASDNDCGNNCPTLPLADYVSRNGAYAGINGSFFCPTEYPSCAGKTNSYDLLSMNKNKHYFNSDNNVYSTNPVVVFGGSWIRFVNQGLGWGRDTGVDGVLMNYPLLISGKQIVFNGSDDAKFNGKGPRGFVANKGNTVFIGFVYNATMSDSAKVLHVLDMENAMNLDEGGSTALWYGGYKAGPGRNIPNAILFIQK